MLRDAGAGLVILDTAPHSESAALAAARLSDFVLIPCRPAIFDLRTIANTIDIVGIAKKPPLSYSMQFHPEVMQLSRLGKL